MKRRREYPSACPSDYVTVEYAHEGRTHVCIPIATTCTGQRLYQADLGTASFPPQASISTAFGDTLMVFVISHELEPEQVTDIVKRLEACTVISPDAFVKQAE